MALRSRSNHSKPTSDTSEIVNNEGEPQNNSISIENKYTSYTFQNFKVRKKCFRENSFCEPEEVQSANKSQNFVRKIIASLERKNKANGEFFTKYNRRNDSNHNFDHSFNRKVETTNKIKNEIPVSNMETEINKVTSEDDNKIQNSRSETPTRYHLPVSSNIGTRKNVSLEIHVKNSNSKKSVDETFNKQENNFKINEQSNTKYYKEAYVHCNSRNDIEVCNHERKEFYDSSSFDPNRYRVELQNRTDTINSYFLESDQDDYKKNTLEKIFIHSEGEEGSLNRSTFRKRLNRSKSLKNFFMSMIKWKKPKTKESPRRFMSCDHLLEDTKIIGSKNDKILPRTSSYQAIVFHQENFEQIKRNATIHPIYGGKRNQQLLEVLAKKNEDRRRFLIHGSMENLVKPSAIKDIVKHLENSKTSQLPQ
ncbi:uncharacterized protein LOC122568445 [Bombus pyrosoma]|uniref:uncharacterized protein LOC122568445 n=1 Tax=Bombus pyrosoma TaxID=396416 RepID=UPI001CB8F532|nr:uncharacterized protein LOC122568445 [Bombus pyrosoma]